MKRYILTMTSLILLLWSYSMPAEDTTDISYILPDNGFFSDETGVWWTSWDDVYNTSTVFFCSTCSEPYVALRCSADTAFNRAEARFGIATTPLNISNVKRQEIVVTIICRGNPDPTYGGGTIFGHIQPEINSAYWGQFLYREPGTSPGYLESGGGFKAETVVDPNSIPPKYNFATLMVSTAWTTITWRFVPIHQNFFRLGFVGVKYVADKYDTPPGPPFTTELQIKQIKIEAIRFY